MYLYVYVYILYIHVNTYIYIYIFIDFHRLMSFEVQSCVNLNGTNGKEGRTQQEKKRFTDQKTFEAIVCK